MQTIRKFVDKVIEFICISFVAIMTVLVTWQVITRYFFKNPSTVTEQLSKYMFVWLVLLAAAYVFGKREHMSMVFIKEKFTGRAAVTVDIIVELIVMGFAIGVLVIGGYRNTLMTMTQSDSALPIKIGMIYSMLPISGALTAFYSLCNIFEITRGFAKKKAPKAE
jgi:TRAP-type transport system small permease protein